MEHEQGGLTSALHREPVNDTSPRLTLIAFALVFLAILAGAILLLTSRPAPVSITVYPPLPTGTPLPTPTPAPITVYITGEVMYPDQILTLPAGSRVQDAVQAAGGVTEGADLVRVNLAARLLDGDQVHVPATGQRVSLPTANAPRLLPINSAAAEDLTMLPGIGPQLAERIIAYRDANGPFQSLDDLDQVEGVGPALLNGIADLITFD